MTTRHIARHGRASHRAASMMLLLLLAVIGSMSAFAAPAAEETPDTTEQLPQLRMDVVTTGTQSIPAFIIERLELDEKYGFELVVHQNAGGAGANWNALRAGQVDGILTNWMDIARNRQQGVAALGAVPFLRWGNGILVPTDSEVTGLENLQGLRIGVYNQNSLDWILIRMAAMELYGFDPEVENTITQGAPGLLIGLMNQGEVDAMLNYGDIITRMSGSEDFRIVFDVQQMLTALEMPSDTPFLYYAFTESFIEENPDVVAAYADAYEEAIQYINENDEVWQDIAVNYDEDDPATIDRLMENSRNKIAPRYYNEMEDDIRDLFVFLRAEFDERVLGVNELPEQIFWSEAGE